MIYCALADSPLYCNIHTSLQRWRHASTSSWTTSGVGNRVQSSVGNIWGIMTKMGHLTSAQRAWESTCNHQLPRRRDQITSGLTATAGVSRPHQNWFFDWHQLQGHSCEIGNMGHPGTAKFFFSSQSNTFELKNVKGNLIAPNSNRWCLFKANPLSRDDRRRLKYYFFVKKTTFFFAQTWYDLVNRWQQPVCA